MNIERVAEDACEMIRKAEPTARGFVSVVHYRGGQPRHAVRILNAGGEDLWPIASVTKTFTATLLATAVVEDRCTLQSTLGDVFGSELGNGDVNSITLQNLALHNSGLPHSPLRTKDVVLHLLRLRSLAKAPKFTDEQLLSAMRGLPELRRGECRYSNFGYGILGLALSRIYGARTFGEALHRHLLQPLEFDGVHLRTADDVESPAAQLMNIPNLGALAPSGGIALTHAAATRWLHLNLLPPSNHWGSVLQLAHGQAHHSSCESRPLGWQLGNRHPNTRWHNGSLPGSYTMCVLSKESGFGLFITHNQNRPLEDFAKVVCAELERGE